MPDAFEAVASSRRREILRLVRNGERSASEIAGEMPEVTFGAVSQQLKVLTDAGLLQKREAGRFRYYAARREALVPLSEWLESMWDDALERLKERSELEARRRGPRRRRGRKR